jgi:hypothetical protein
MNLAKQFQGRAGILEDMGEHTDIKLLGLESYAMQGLLNHLA